MQLPVLHTLCGSWSDSSSVPMVLKASAVCKSVIGSRQFQNFHGDVLLLLLLLVAPPPPPPAAPAPAAAYPAAPAAPAAPAPAAPAPAADPAPAPAAAAAAGGIIRSCAVVVSRVDPIYFACPFGVQVTGDPEGLCAEVCF